MDEDALLLVLLGLEASTMVVFTTDCLEFIKHSSDFFCHAHPSMYTMLSALVHIAYVSRVVVVWAITPKLLPSWRSLSYHLIRVAGSGHFWLSGRPLKM